MRTCSECGAAIDQYDRFCSDCGASLTPESPDDSHESTDVYEETDYEAHQGGLFRNYVFDAGHVRSWEWIVMGLLLLVFPPVGCFVAGYILIGCVHKVDATGSRINPDGRSSAGLLSLLLVTIGALIVGVFFLFVLVILFV